MQEQDARLFVRHVMVDRHDQDAGAPERLQHALQLRLEHCEVAVDHRLIVGAREGRPGVHAHGRGHVVPVHLRGAADDDLVHAGRQRSGRAQDRFDLLGIERRPRRVDLGLRRLALAARGLADLGEDPAYSGRERRLLRVPGDVHEHHLRRVPEEVVVERRHLEPLVQGDAHHRVHLVFEENQIAHHDDSIPRSLERRPRGEPQGRGHAHARRVHGEVGPRNRDLEDAFFLVEGALRPRELLDPRGVQAERRRLSLGTACDRNEEDEQKNRSTHRINSFHE